MRIDLRKKPIIPLLVFKLKVYLLMSERNKSAFKQCSNLISTKNTTLAFCIKFHEWLDQCPQKCGFYQEGSIGKIDELKSKNYNFECHYFTHSTLISGEYRCKLFEQDNPLCESCKFVKNE